MCSFSWKQSVVVSVLLYAAVAYVPSGHGGRRHTAPAKTNVCTQAAY
ncbi:MAG: hypothetical protein JST61_15940 [Acidobacteria bacterium]|nr:hypothetical protein [Acidobacteriota bacterium]